MDTSALFVLDDGVLASCSMPDGSPPIRVGDVCIVDIDDVLEVGRHVGPCGAAHKPCHGYLAGRFIRIAAKQDEERLPGNAEATARARETFLRWAEENRRPVHLLRMRFSLKRDALSMLVHCAEFVNLNPAAELLERRFQTKVRAGAVSPREICGAIGGMGICGRQFCCNTGVCGKVSVDVRMAKQQSVSLHDFAASGVCGKLKCCLCYEMDPAGDMPASGRRAQ